MTRKPISYDHLTIVDEERPKPALSVAQSSAQSSTTPAATADSELLRDISHQTMLYLRVDDANREAFEEARSSPPLNYAKGGSTIDLSFWRAPERLFDEPDELVAWARLALAAARRVASKRGRAAKKRSRHAG